jgi:hypothetical protein
LHGWLGIKHQDTSERQGVGDSDKGGFGDRDADHHAPALRSSITLSEEAAVVMAIFMSASACH